MNLKNAFDWMKNEFRTNPVLRYIIICWGFTFLLTLIAHPFNPKRDPILIHFDRAEIIAIDAHVVERATNRWIHFPISSSIRSPLVLYESRLLDLRVLSATKRMPNVSLSRAFSTPSSPLEFQQIDKTWEIQNLQLEFQAVNTAHLGGLWLFFVILASAAYGLISLFIHWRKLRHEIIFAVLLIGGLAYLAQLHWPGHLSYDTLVDYQLALAGKYNAHTLIFYSCLNYAYVLLYRSMAMGMLFNLILTVLFFSWIYSQSRRILSAHIITNLCVAFIFSSQINQQMMIFQNRDITFTWFFLFFLGSIARPKSSELLQFFLLILCVAIRKETIVLLPFLVALKIFYTPARFRKILLHFAIVMGILSAFFWGYRSFRVINNDPVYTLTAYINPMGHILAKYGKSALSQEDQAELSYFMDLDRAISVHSRYDINEYHKGTFYRKRIYKRNGEIRIRKIALRLFWNYPVDFLKNRFDMTLVLMGFKPGTAWFNNEAFTDPRFHQLQPSLPTTLLSDGPEAWKVIERAQTSIGYRLLFASCLPGMVLIFLTLLFWRKAPATAAASILMLVRTLLVLSLAPAAYHKYVWCFSLWGALVPAFAWLEHHEVRGGLKRLS
jgi:hypothetical protein